MNLILTAPTWLIVVLVLALLAAALQDAIRFKISNLTCGIVLLTAIVAMVLQGFSMSLWQNLSVCIAILVLGTAAFAGGWLGGGDVKLLAVLGLWFDLRSAVALLAAVFIAGGLVAFLYIAARWARLRKQSLDKGGGRVPYGIAIAAGALFMFGVQFQQRPTNSVVEQIRAIEAQQR